MKKEIKLNSSVNLLHKKVSNNLKNIEKEMKDEFLEQWLYNYSKIGFNNSSKTFKYRIYRIKDIKLTVDAPNGESYYIFPKFVCQGFDRINSNFNYMLPLSYGMAHHLPLQTDFTFDLHELNTAISENILRLERDIKDIEILEEIKRQKIKVYL